MTNTVQPTRLATMEKTVSRFFNMLNSHCPGNVVPLLTTDVEILADETTVGQEAANAFFLRLWEAYPCITFVTTNMIVGETGVAAEVSYTAGPNGKGARCMVFSFRDDLIRRVRVY